LHNLFSSNSAFHYKLSVLISHALAANGSPTLNHLILSLQFYETWLSITPLTGSIAHQPHTLPMAGESKPNARKAGADAGPSSAKKVKVTTAPAEPKSKKTAVRKPANSKAAGKKPYSAEADDTESNEINTAFAWKACADDEDALKRLDIKEEAVIQGLRHANRVASILAPITGSSHENITVGGSETVELQNWLKELGM
jgi:hypothetical protein